MGTTNLSPDLVSAPAWNRHEGGRGISFNGLEPLYLLQMAFDLELSWRPGTSRFGSASQLIPG